VEDLQSGLVLVMLVERVVLQPRWQEIIRRHEHDKKQKQLRDGMNQNRNRSTLKQENAKQEWVGLEDHGGSTVSSPTGPAAAAAVASREHKNVKQEMIWYRTPYTIHHTLYTIPRTLYIIHYTLYTVHYTLIHYTLYTIHHTLYTIHCTLYTRYAAQLKPKPQSAKLQLSNIELALHMLRKYAPKGSTVHIVLCRQS
jgi:hypothetical protein